MDPRFRPIFNREFTPELYARYQRELAARLDCRFEFRLAETPLFIPPDLARKLESSAAAIVAQLSRPEAIERMKAAIPPEWDTPGMDALPHFAQVDFAITRSEDGTLEPKLIELQGFPSLTSFQVVQRDVWNEVLNDMPGLEGDWSCWFSGFTRESFLRHAHATIVGRHDPVEVVLLDLDPPTQKTYPDFAATKLLFGVDAVDPTTLEKRGRELWRRDANGRAIRVRRIYNRIVFDELARKNVALPFDYREPLDVEWAPHPNWYWVWSKYSLPLLDHPSVPRARYLSEVGELPDDLAQRYVLKPLFSFAGGGVNIEPTADDVAAIPAAERGNWCLQEKIEYAPVLASPDGGVKVEIRMMFLRAEGTSELRLAQNLVRLSRGRMLGVDFNKDFTWVGSSVGLMKR